MRDKELKLEETEASLTLGRAGKGRVQVKFPSCVECQTVKGTYLPQTETILKKIISHKK